MDDKGASFHLVILSEAKDLRFSGDTHSPCITRFDNLACPPSATSVKIIECPRDAWQGLPLTIPSEVKAEYLRALVTAGFRHIDAVSFVSAKAVPQMADSEQVLALADLPSLATDQLEVIGIVVNVKGAERAINSGGVNTLGFPYSISPGFLERNQHQTPEEAVEALETVGSLAYKAGLDIVAYISMAFGNPYGDPWSVDEVVAACDLLADSGIEMHLARRHRRPRHSANHRRGRRGGHRRE